MVDYLEDGCQYWMLRLRWMLRTDDGVADQAESMYLYRCRSCWQLRSVIVALVLHVLWNVKGMIRPLCLVRTSWWRGRCGAGAQVLSLVQLVVVEEEYTSVVGDSLGAVKCGHDVDRGIYVAVRLTEDGGVVIVVAVVDGMVLWVQR